MKFQLLDTVVLDRDMPDFGLCVGDLGAVVHLHEPDDLEVEFVTASGDTLVLVSLKVIDVRAVQATDVISVRPTRRRTA